MIDELYALEMQANEEEWDIERCFSEFRRMILEEDVIEGFGEYD